LGSSALTARLDAAAVIFDIGGVLIDWNPRYLYRALFDGDEAAMEHFLAHVCSHDWNLTQDAGRPFAEGVAELAARFPEQAELIAAYDTRWEDMVKGAIDGTVVILRELEARGTPLYCLTNFSTEKLPLCLNRFDFFDAFDGIVVSGEIGMVKPDRGIYDHLVETYELTPSQCLFIDDNQANVAGAREAGWQAVRYVSPDQLRRDLANTGLR
jgi:2-haloacid dehalogenase